MYHICVHEYTFNTKSCILVYADAVPSTRLVYVWRLCLFGKVILYQTTVNSFFSHFRRHFSAKQLLTLQDSGLALFQEHKRCSIQSMAEKSGRVYQRLQYFFSESKWDDIQLLNQSRLDLICRLRPTRPTRKGVFIIAMEMIVAMARDPRFPKHGVIDS